MNELEQKQEQIFWCVGALERLQSLGVIGDFQMYVRPDQIDYWQEVDQKRHEVIGDNSVLASAVTYLCNRSGLADQSQIDLVVKIVTCFRDTREDVIKWFLSKTL